MISVVTRTFKRPRLLKIAIQALERQTYKNFEHIIIRDEVGISITETHRRLRTQEVSGDWVWIYDDDNEVTDEKFFEKVSQSEADVIICQCRIGQRTLPDVWPPERAHIDAMNIVSSRRVWDAHKKDFGLRYEGDWDYIKSVFNSRQKIQRFQEIVAKTQRISKGKAEEDMLRLKDRIRIVEACATGDWSYYPGQTVEVTEENYDRLESLLKGALAEPIGGFPETPFKKRTETKDESASILPDGSPADVPRGRRKTSRPDVPGLD